MGLQITVLTGFLLTLCVPVLYRIRPADTGKISSLLPIALFVYFCLQFPGISEKPIHSAASWIPSLGIGFSFFLDGLSLVFACLITGIGAFILIYADAYLSGKPHLNRFFAAMVLFMTAMLGLVLSDNLITLFVFWELTSISSYFLIGFDHERPEARTAALQALLVTGAGGLALMAGLIMLGAIGGSMAITDLLNAKATVTGHDLYTPMLILVLLGAFTKSAQFPFHFWLPNAMEAPAPVSAYLHSATMVKAGIYLMARLNPVLGGTPEWYAALKLVGGITMLGGAALAFHQRYFKRYLAYSTVSALGMLTFLIGIGSKTAVKAAMVFLLAHSLYKATLFLVAGTVDHETGQKEPEAVGGLLRQMPVTAVAAILAGLSMAGIIPLIGFIGKELFYEASWYSPVAAAAATVAGILTNALIVAVALIAGMMPFLRTRTTLETRVHEAPWPMWAGPLVFGSTGLLLGAAAALLTQPILAPAIQAMAGRPVPVKITLWHGFNLPLLFDSMGIAAGVALFVWRHQVRRLWAVGTPMKRLGPERGYFRLLDGMNAVARWQTRVLQSGYLRYYLMSAVLFTLITSIYVFLTYGGTARLFTIPVSRVHAHEIILGALILMAVVAVVRAKTRLAAVAALGVIGFSVALLFVFFGAPDLAMTQFVVETLMVVLMVLVLYHLPPYSQYSSRPHRWRDLVVAMAGGGLMTVLVLIATSIRWRPPISGYFIDNSLPLAHGRNIVNVILVDFRAIDTLGEITVLAAAALGVYALIKLVPDKKGSAGE